MKKLKWLEEFDKIHKKRLSSPYRVPKSVLFIKPCSPSRARRRFFWPNRSQKYVFSSSSHLTNQFTQSFPTEQELRRASSLSDDCTLMARNTQEGRETLCSSHEASGQASHVFQLLLLLRDKGRRITVVSWTLIPF